MKKIETKIFAGVFVFSVCFFLALSSPILAVVDVSNLQSDIKSLEKEADKTEAELNQAKSLLEKNKSQVNTTQYLINKTETEISRKESELNNLDKRTDLNKKILGEYLLEVYLNDQQDPLVRLVSDNKDLSDLVENFDQMLSVKEKILSVLKEIEENKNKINQVKEELADKKDDHEKLLDTKLAEQKGINQDIKEAVLTLDQINKKIAKLRSTLSSFLGKSYNAKDIVDAINFASSKTGVRKQFLMAMLDKETDLGRFTGGCTYKKSKMGPDNEKIFKSVCSELGYNYEKMKVSCALSYGIGGAMGVAQFMPTTWSGYKSAIASLTGHNPPDPWNLTDGVMGMAEKLRRGGAGSKSGEHNAAAIYYCGSRLSRAVCQNYAKTVISWSKGYDEYF